MSAVEWGLLVNLCILWGGSFFFQKVALSALPPFTVLLARVGLAAAALWIAAGAAGYRLPPPGRPWAPFVVMAAILSTLAHTGMLIRLFQSTDCWYAAAACSSASSRK